MSYKILRLYSLGLAYYVIYDKRIKDLVRIMLSYISYIFLVF